MRDAGMEEVTDEERRLLGTYVNGPRIWDAASVFAIVVRLDSKGMVAPVGGGAYAITAKGLAALDPERFDR